MKRIAYILLLVSCIVLLSSCAAGNYLKTEGVRDTDIKGSFTLILYGSKYSNDIETIAILDIEGDDYSFEPYAPEFDYKIKKGVPADEALEETERFISWHSLFLYYQISKILDYKDNIIGYEIRPLYQPLAFGTSDVLDVDYRIKNNKVIVRIKLKPEIERMLFDGDKSKEDN
ncbi:hypothetical protein JZK55_21940 [Dissulfurispira thermophila]|uniref:Lipoprotein n=2 Tax=root TaxID=1 RepID=A0A7G1H5A4_9BACT|nr:hypothetical protein [Dissulfurispira thermophila]BCB97272.1 hypothetical protein JZK55_21940 [Dissulfurispira thermophila]